MIYENKKEKNILIKCDCGAEMIEISKLFENESHMEYYITIWLMAFMTEQDGFFYKIKNRIKTAWNILTKGTHLVQDIVLSKEKFEELKNIIKDFE